MIGAKFDEVLYADDSIIFSEDDETLEKLLHGIEEVGANLGLRLNKKKSVLLLISRNIKHPTVMKDAVKANSTVQRGVRYRNGDKVNEVKEVKYLGCRLNEKGDPQSEMNQRRLAVQLIWRKMGEFWKGSNCNKRKKIIVYNAVIKSKLLFGAESMQINQSELKKMDALQWRGYRQIFKWDTTYKQMLDEVDRTNTNDRLRTEVEKEMNRDRKNRKYWEVKLMREEYEELRERWWHRTHQLPEGSPMREVTFEDQTFSPRGYPFLRSSKPRNNWSLETGKRSWKAWKQAEGMCRKFISWEAEKEDEEMRTKEYDPRCPDQIIRIKDRYRKVKSGLIRTNRDSKIRTIVTPVTRF